MDARDKEINSWLMQSELQFLVICGMAGSGKSTLAKYIVSSNWQNFESISIVEDIGSKCKAPHDILKIQEQLFKDILKGKDTRIPSVCQGTLKIEDLLKRKKALIVLDDVVKQSQVEALLGFGNIYKESKIIITTEVDIGNWLNSKSRWCQEYRMKLLNDEESLELLSLHAFGSKIPKEGYEELAKQVIHYCEGNPLALEVLSSSLSENDSILSWKSALDLLGKDFHDDVYSVLKRSFDLLPYESDKEVFLDISCFFVGIDIDYVVKILGKDYSALSNIKTLTRRCLLYVTPNKKLFMHRLLQEMGRSIVDRESPIPAKRSRVWRNEDSYEMLRRGKSSETMKGLKLDMHMLEADGLKSKQKKESPLSTNSLQNMDQLKLLQLNFVNLTGSYDDFSVHLRWLCWVGFSESTIHFDLFMRNMVALDMSYSYLKEFELPEILQSLKILNLKDSCNLLEIRNFHRIPNLEALILWNCLSLVHVCETIAILKNLTLLNMTGCENLCKRVQINSLVGLKASTSGGGSTHHPSFPLPLSLQRLFFNDCKLECSDYLPLCFSVQTKLQYLNLGNSLFQFLPRYDHLKDLRVLDLSFCLELKRLLRLPSRLSELYVYYCKSLEKITFESPRFTLQEFGYEGCGNLSEIEGFIKLIPLAKLDGIDLGHMKWLKEYENHEVCLVGDDELMVGRNWNVQMLYEFDIMSISLPDIKNLNMTPQYISESSYVCFNVPPCPMNKRLKGLNVTFKYTISDDDDWVWFAKIKTSNGVDLMYNPKVFGKPGNNEVGIWLSYWPIGNTLQVGDDVNVSIIVLSGLIVSKCGASLVFTDNEVVDETLVKNTGWVETLGGDLTGFQLSTGAYFLCRRDFFELMEVGRLTPSWFSILVDDTIEPTEVRGWRKTGLPRQAYQSFTELKTIRCIIHGPESEEIYRIAEMSKSIFVDKTLEFTSSILGETMQSGNTSEFSDATTKAVGMDINMSEASVANASEERTSSLLKEKMESLSSEFNKLTTKETKTFDPFILHSRKPSSASSFDVYLSFRGEDTRNSFTDHLYMALVRAGLHIFRDNDELHIGETPHQEIERAIVESKASIVVLSENYATSSWCLDELWLILEQRRMHNHFVLPVFYYVEPSDVRNQTNKFNIEVKASTRWTDDNVKRWKAALTEVANLSGFVSSGGESKFVKEIVHVISMKLAQIEVDLPPNLIGMETRYGEISSLLNKTNHEILVIQGIGGSGKSTLAKYIYRSNCNYYENTSFIEDVGRRCEGRHDLLKLQEQLLRDIFEGKRRKIRDVSQGMRYIEEVLLEKKILIVLDDIVERDQLVALLGTGKINAQCKIIMTTRQDTSKWFDFTYWRCQKYEMKLLDDDESLMLFSHHAFGSNIPTEGLKELAVQAVEYCKGIPLALEVLGSSLLEDNSIQSWERALDFLKEDIHLGIYSVIKRSYDTLPNDTDRVLFLLIACFFIGNDVDSVVEVLKHDYSTASVIETLTKRCLLYVSPNKKLMMHQLVQDVGMDIVHQISSKGPRKRSRNWISMLADKKRRRPT